MPPQWNRISIESWMEPLYVPPSQWSNVTRQHVLFYLTGTSGRSTVQGVPWSVESERGRPGVEGAEGA